MRKSFGSLLCMVLGLVCCVTMLTVGIIAATQFVSPYSLTIKFADKDLMVRISLLVDDTAPENAVVIFDNSKSAPATIANSVATKSTSGDVTTVTLGSTYSNLNSDSNFRFIIENLSPTLDVTLVFTITGTANASTYGTSNILYYTATGSSYVETPGVDTPKNTPVNITKIDKKSGSTIDSDYIDANVQVHTEGNIFFEFDFDKVS